MRENTEKSSANNENVRLWEAASGKWGTVREDYGEDDQSWNYFAHDQS